MLSLWDFFHSFTRSMTSLIQCERHYNQWPHQLIILASSRQEVRESWREGWLFYGGEMDTEVYWTITEHFNVFFSLFASHWLSFTLSLCVANEGAIFCSLNWKWERWYRSEKVAEDAASCTLQNCSATGTVMMLWRPAVSIMVVTHYTHAAASWLRRQVAAANSDIVLVGLFFSWERVKVSKIFCQSPCSCAK